MKAIFASCMYVCMYTGLLAQSVLAVRADSSMYFKKIKIEFYTEGDAKEGGSVTYVLYQGGREVFRQTLNEAPWKEKSLVADERELTVLKTGERLSAKIILSDASLNSIVWRFRFNLYLTETGPSGQLTERLYHKAGFRTLDTRGPDYPRSDSELYFFK
jgi:hypothetical protein